MTTSIGCIAIGDEASEDLFVLAARTGLKHISVILAPVDFRIHDPPKITSQQPAWIQDLYGTLRQELGRYRKDG